MQQELEQLETNLSIEWQEFVIGDLFEKLDLKFLKPTFDKEKDISKERTSEFNLPLVNAKNGNNGIMYYGKISDFETAEMTIDIVNDGAISTGNVYFQPQKTGVLYNAYLIKSKFDINKNLLLFFTSTIQKSIKLKFGYENKASWNKVKEEKIQLPTIKQNGNTEIAFDFMEQFIATLQAERLATLQAYLSKTGLKNYVLSDKEQNALDSLETVDWGTFKIEDVLVWQKNISELNPLHLDALTVSKEKKYPFYGQATNNNGIIEYRHLKDDVLNNALSKPTILIHSNNQNTVYLDTPFYLKDGHGATSVLQSENLNKMTAQFFMGSIKKVILQKYTYNSKATKIELKNSDINLPVKPDHTPDYDYMTLVISGMQKVVIKNVVDYLDLRLEKSGEVVRK